MFQGRLLEVEVGFNKAGFDGASEKPIWIYNFTACIFWDDFDGYLLWWRRWDLWWREWEWRWPLLSKSLCLSWFLYWLSIKKYKEIIYFKNK